MRLFEIIVLAFLICTIYLLFRKNKKLFLYSLFGGTISCLFHFYLESYRWQMVPAYLLFVIIFITYKKCGHSLFWMKGLLVVWFLCSIFLPIVVPVF
ncbi:uncharacterized protein METZ01_LOCUS109220, partial [marine metagenome]